jgi:predicted metal-dependent HD superfamily phosphohydrolase
MEYIFPGFDSCFHYPLVRNTITLGEVTRQHAGRSYHNITHLRQLWLAVEKLQPTEDLEVLFLATIFHDWFTGIPQAEERSLSIALDRIIGLSEAQQTLLSDLILATRHTTPLSSTHVSICLFKDADLSILGSSREIYQEYLTNVRQEYQHLSDTAWNAGRTQFVSQLLQAPRLFTSNLGIQLWETQARLNLKSELTHAI